MYCPHCGVQNAPDTRFCRGCGEDLKLVSQAITKSLPLMIAHRVDEAIDRGRGGWRSYQLFRAEHRKALSQIALGLSSLFVIVWILMLGHSSVSFASGFLLVMTISLIMTSLHELWVKRRRSHKILETQKLPSSLRTRELLSSQEGSPQSITESTTRDLKVGAMRDKRADDLN